MLGGTLGLMSAAIGDAYFSYNSLLLHCDGANGTTSLVDSSPRPKTVNTTPPSSLNASAAKYGTSGIKGPTSGSAGGVHITQHADFNFGTGDATVECEARFTSTNGSQFVWDFRDMSATGGGPVLYVYTTNALYFWYNGSQVSLGVVPSLNVFHHIRWSRIAGVSRVFIDGVQVGGDIADTTNYSGATPNFGVNCLGGSAGWIDLDEIRVTKGVGRSSAGFTRPVAAWPNS